MAKVLNVCFVIANNPYGGESSDLQGAQADGTAVGNLLEHDFGWKIVPCIRYPASVVLTELREMHVQPYAQDMELREANILVFCSAHGVTDNNDHFVLLGRGERLRTSDLVDAVGAAINGLTGRGIRPCRVALILDCCRIRCDPRLRIPDEQAAARSAASKRRAAVKDIDARIQQATTQLPVVCWCSCQDGQVSWEAPLGNDGGPYNPGSADVSGKFVWRGLFSLAIEQELKKVKPGERLRLAQLIVPVSERTKQLAQDTYMSEFGSLAMQCPSLVNSDPTVANDFMFEARGDRQPDPRVAPPQMADPTTTPNPAEAPTPQPAGTVRSNRGRLLARVAAAAICSLLGVLAFLLAPARLPLQDGAYWLFRGGNVGSWLPQFYNCDAASTVRLKDDDSQWKQLISFGLAPRQGDPGHNCQRLSFDPGRTTQGWCGAAWTQYAPTDLLTKAKLPAPDLRGATRIRYEIRSDRPVVAQVKALTLGGSRDLAGDSAKTPIEGRGGYQVHVTPDWQEGEIATARAALSRVVAAFYVAVSTNEQAQPLDTPVSIYVDNIRWEFAHGQWVRWAYVGLGCLFLGVATVLALVPSRRQA